MERLQRAAPETKFVKCFSCVGNALMVDPDFGGQKPSMFICGNDEGAKKITADLLTEIGWETEDLGKVEAARAIEPLCILWCIPGMIRGQWRHAYKVLK
jgi:predicted dinucleotide-binding enzyme